MTGRMHDRAFESGVIEPVFVLYKNIRFHRYRNTVKGRKIGFRIKQQCLFRFIRNDGDVILFLKLICRADMVMMAVSQIYGSRFRSP